MKLAHLALGTVMFLGLNFAAHAADAVITGDKNNVNAACSAEAATAGCGSEKVGTGLLKCIHAYKQAHKADFNVSPGCKTAMQTLHADKKAGK